MDELMAPAATNSNKFKNLTSPLTRKTLPPKDNSFNKLISISD
jgi:hypothetical protein